MAKAVVLDRMVEPHALSPTHLVTDRSTRGFSLCRLPSDSMFNATQTIAIAVSAVI